MSNLKRSPEMNNYGADIVVEEYEDLSVHSKLHQSNQLEQHISQISIRGPKDEAIIQENFTQSLTQGPPQFEKHESHSSPKSFFRTSFLLTNKRPSEKGMPIISEHSENHDEQEDNINENQSQHQFTAVQVVTKVDDMTESERPTQQSILQDNHTISQNENPKFPKQLMIDTDLSDVPAQVVN